jgi:hypothetical protein
MRVTEDQFFSLLEEVERQGGHHVDGNHRPRQIKFEARDPKPGDPKFTKGATQGCNMPFQLMVRYDPSEKVTVPAAKGTGTIVVTKDENANDAGTVLVCAADDNVAMWPRFAH